jgi:hypothetical protein
MVALVAMCLTWYPGIDATTSLTNAQAAAPTTNPTSANMSAQPAMPFVKLCST